MMNFLVGSEEKTKMNTLAVFELNWTIMLRAVVKADYSYL